MDNPSPSDRTQAGNGTEPSVAPTIVASPLPGYAATIAGPAPRPGNLPVISPDGEYAIEREIARGGMGCVLQAQDRKLARTVAMKVMLRRRAGEEDQQRFLQEARVLGQLAHPNIVPVHDMGVDEQGRPFYTMKFVQGGTQDDVIAKLKSGDKQTVAKYPLAMLLTIFQKVCDAVAFAHSRGIIHRDLKPMNIMVGEFGEVLVMDWGLAKILPGTPAAELANKNTPMWCQSGFPGSKSAFFPQSPADAPSSVDAADDAAESMVPLMLDQSIGSTGAYATLEGSVMGSPQYMSPEQAEGRVNELDARTDVFLLGGILYTLLTLRPPVEGATVAELLAKTKKGEIIPPTAFNTGSATQQAPRKAHGATVDPKRIFPLHHLPGGRVPVALSAVAMKALAVQPRQRYQSVAALAADITAYQGGFATTAENANALMLVRLFIRRHKGLTTAATLVILLTLGFMAKVISSERRATANAVAAQSNAERAQANATTAEQNERRADANAKTADANAQIAAANEAKAKATLADLRRTAPVFYTQAKVDLEEGKFDQAVEKIGYAIQLDDSIADYHLLLANLHESSQDLRAAAEGYRRVLALRPTDAAAQTNLALCETLRGETGGAPLGHAQQFKLLEALRQQKRLVEAAPLAALIDPDIKVAKAAILSRLREARKLPGWSDNRVAALPDGTFSVSLGNLPPIDFSVLKGQPVSVLVLTDSGIADLSSLAGLSLKELNLTNAKVTDLSPLHGMSLEALNLYKATVSDLSPLRGMKLRRLNLFSVSRLASLAPLAGMPLATLDCGGCKEIRDLSPLQGAPLVELYINTTAVASLAPLTRMHLTILYCNDCKNISDISPLRGLPLVDLRIQETALADLSPLAGAPLKHLDITHTKVTDLAPLGDCVTLEELRLGRLSVVDLAPLAKLHLTSVDFWSTKITSIALLRGQPLRYLGLSKTAVTDLSPLADCTTLEEIVLPDTAGDLSILRKLPRLKRISFPSASDTSSHATQTAEEFWKEYDARPKAPAK